MPSRTPPAGTANGRAAAATDVQAPGLAADVPDRLARAIAGGKASNLHGLVVLRAGQLVLEHYGAGDDYRLGEPLGSVAFGPETLHDIRSVTKSVVGLLYGIALGRGQAPEPEEPLLRHFPEYPDLADDERRARLTVRHALTMTLGLEWDENVPYTSAANSEIAMELAPDRYRYALDRPIVEEPGVRWSYSGGASAIVGRLIAVATGQPLDEFAQSVLFEPLGIARFEWTKGADGEPLAASGLRLTPRDLARLGQLVLDGGRRGHEELVPARWLDEALAPHVDIGPDFAYGYQWYLGATPGTAQGLRWYGGMGNGGQRLFVMPDVDLVVAMTAGNYDSADQSATPTVILDEVILPGLARV